MKRDYQIFNQDKLEPPFMAKLNKKLGESWGSLGSISVRISQTDSGQYKILFFPAVREMYGGKQDGELFFPGFYLNIGKFIRIFDQNPAPKVVFDCSQNGQIDHLLFAGKIDTHDVKIAILSEPPNGQLPVEKVYAIGPKKGTIESNE